MNIGRAVAALTLILVPWRSPAQEAPAGVAACGSRPEEGGVVRGRLVPDPGDPAVRFRVHLRGTGGDPVCGVLAARDGTFELRGVSAGSYTLAFTLSAEYAPVADIALAVTRDAPVQLDIPVHAVDPLRTCPKKPACAAVLLRHTSVELTGSDEERLTLAVYRTAIAAARNGWDREEAWVACIDDPGLVRSLSQVYPAVAPASDCAFPDPREEAVGARPGMMYAPTGAPARAVRVHQVERTSAGAARASLSWTAGPRWGARYLCMLERLDGLWVPRRCRMTEIS